MYLPYCSQKYYKHTDPSPASASKASQRFSHRRHHTATRSRNRRITPLILLPPTDKQHDADQQNGAQAGKPQRSDEQVLLPGLARVDLGIRFSLIFSAPRFVLRMDEEIDDVPVRAAHGEEVGRGVDGDDRVVARGELFQ
jgi:hypothetical protein